MKNVKNSIFAILSQIKNSQKFGIRNHHLGWQTYKNIGWKI